MLNIPFCPGLVLTIILGVSSFVFNIFIERMYTKWQFPEHRLGIVLYQWYSKSEGIAVVFFGGERK